MSLYKYAKQYVANQSRYAHLNAFISRVDPSILLNRPKSNPPESKDDGYYNVRDRPVGIKDNICTKELETTAASGILKDFTSPYDATVVKLLQDAGAVVVGKTNMDEFGMGSHSTHSHAGPVKMQRYKGEETSAGGSSGGSAMAVASAQCWAALGTDTGGSVRLPAAYSGVLGFKPSYGLLSRWGVIAYANSLDTVGIFGKNARNVKCLFDKLNVHDPQDPTSLPPSTRSWLSTREVPQKPLRIGVPLDYNIATLHPVVRNAWMRALKALAGEGHTLHSVRLPATQRALPAYYVLAPAEASSNLAKYDGVRFGSRAEGIDGTPENVLFAKTRGQGFGAEVQRRILLGAFSLSAQAIDNYFIKAQKVRRLVQQDFNSVFATPNPLGNNTSVSEEDGGVDVLICPTAPTLAPSLVEVQNQDPIQAYMNDVFTVPASLAGLPAISVPVHITDEERAAIHGDHDIKESAGIQIIGQYGDDNLVLYTAEALQSVCKTVQRTTLPDMTAWGVSSLGESTNRARKLFSALAVAEGISIAEAMPIGTALYAEKKKDIDNLLEVNLGGNHLDMAAALFRTTREKYVAKFIQKDDPVAAEKAYYEEHAVSKHRVDEAQSARVELERKRRLAMAERDSVGKKSSVSAEKIRFVGN